jgi:hypothetical protein
VRLRSSLMVCFVVSNQSAITNAFLISVFSDADLEGLVAKLTGDNFEPYLTSVGGSGLGVLSPYHPMAHTSSSLLTPDEEGHASVVPQESLRAAFESSTVGELNKWADDRGRWLYV